MTKILGADKKCLRCRQNKPYGTTGKGICLSRRGSAAICSLCGTEEAMYDFSKSKKAGIPGYMEEAEVEFRKLLKQHGVLKEVVK